jgi:hypothetical protein
MLDRQACLPNLPAGHLGDSTQYENTRQLAVPFSPLQITYSEGSQCALTMHVHSRVIVNNHSAGLRYDGLYSRGRKRFWKRDFRVRVAFLSLTIGSVLRHRLGVSMCKHLAALVSR